VRFCVVGAGAIGGYMGAKLALAGDDVTLVMRGAHHDAVKARGLTLIGEDGAEQVVTTLRASNAISDIGPQGAVILGMKAHQVTPVVAEVAAALGPDTLVITTQNGIPWWYFLQHGGEFEGRGLESVDPGGVIAAHLPVDRVIGCVVYPACELTAPGVIRHIEGNRFSLGELDGAQTPRIAQVAERFRAAGFKSPVLSDIRSELWLKLWGNLSFNPISALTHASLGEICRFAPTRELAARMMTEARTIAEKLGIQFRVSLEKRIAGAEAVGEHKTSMLQDVEAGKAIELEALVGSVMELGRITGTPTPSIDVVYACTALLAKTLNNRGLKIQD
jgi:2-dehydropantoate 2-reductase